MRRKKEIPLANRDLKPSAGNLEVNVVELNAAFSVGAAGAVVANSLKGMGFSSVVKEATAGQYTITLSDRWNRLLSVDAQVIFTAIAACLPKAQIIATPATMQSSFKSNGQVVIQFMDAAGAAANPDSGASVMIDMRVRNSTVGPQD
jgi:hypothetical protein